MADTLKLTVYVAVDDNGDYGVSTEDESGAYDDYEQNYGSAVIAYYKVNLTIPTPRTRTIEVSAVAGPDDQPEGYGTALKVSYNSEG